MHLRVLNAWIRYAPLSLYENESARFHFTVKGSIYIYYIFLLFVGSFFSSLILINHRSEMNDQLPK